MKPVLSDHAWAKKKWSLNRGGLLIEVVKPQLGHHQVFSLYWEKGKDLLDVHACSTKELCCYTIFLLCSGNSIVVGALGQQLVSLASFAFFLAGYEIQTVDFSKESAFTDGMKSLFRQAGLEGKTIGVVIKVHTFMPRVCMWNNEFSL